MTAMSADQWLAHLPRPPLFTSEALAWPRAKVRIWREFGPETEQPALDCHLLAQHRGGTLQASRIVDGAPTLCSLRAGTLSIIPAGRPCTWSGHEAREVVHLYLAPSSLANASVRFGLGHATGLHAVFGIIQPLLLALFGEIVTEARKGDGSAAYLDTLFDAFLHALLREHATTNPGLRGGKELLAPFRLARIIEFIDDHLSAPISLSQLSQAAGGSPFHFARAFRNAVGVTPHQFVLRRRIDRARALLAQPDTSLEDVASDCGFRDREHFSKTFLRLMGATPSRYRRHMGRYGGITK